MRLPSIFITIHVLNLHSGPPEGHRRGDHVYKYSFKGQVHTARDFYEARYQAGLPLSDTFQSVSHFVVRFWQWDDAGRDYAIEILNTPGHQIFTAYDEALVCYNTMVEFFPDEIADDIKLELVHFHLGETYELESTILYPPVHTWQW